ncbi:MAG: DUF4214 domain-containing protein [Clostridia bacterium]|nr:DUF4214 domain-containing protein [Clostridia bacterium]
MGNEKMIRHLAASLTAAVLVLLVFAGAGLRADETQQPEETTESNVVAANELLDNDDQEIADPNIQGINNPENDKKEEDQNKPEDQKTPDETHDTTEPTDPTDSAETTVTPEPTETPDATVTPEPTDTPEPTENPDKEREEQVRGFVERLYTYCLGRGSDVDGISFWANELMQGHSTGAQVASLFVFSPEYESFETSNDEYLTMLYKAFFGREPDQDGFDYWKFQIDNSGCSRKRIFQDFVNSTEFNTICEEYDIIRGEYRTDDPKDSLPENALFSPSDIDVYNFAERLYDKCLGRQSDSEGIKFWTRILIDKKQSGAEVAYEFVFSKEYTEKETTDEEFLTMLYYTFFNREPDEEGFNFWMDYLKNTMKTRKWIFENFVNSREYKEICEKYGIDRGSYYSDVPCDQYTDVAIFVTRLYTEVLQREPEQEGLDYWTLSIGGFEVTPMQASNCFFDSKEFIDNNYSNEEYVSILYDTCMGRPADEEGKAFWVDKIESGKMTKLEVRQSFFDSPEFAKIMADSGIVEKPIVTVAKSQVGQQGGKPYYTWYGYNYRIEWCATFVSWCADQCGYIDSGKVPKYKWCMDAKDWFNGKGEWVNGNKYRPKSGDIIFFDWNGDGVIDHTGIVVGTDAKGYIHTVEGNKDDAVRNDRVVKVGDKTICGYGIPKY